MGSSQDYVPVADEEPIASPSPAAEPSAAWRGSRSDMLSYDSATGEQVTFIYLPDGSRLPIGGGGDPVEQAAAIIAAHNDSLED